MVTAQLICFFVFAHVKSWLSHDAGHLILKEKLLELDVALNFHFFTLNLTNIMRKPVFDILNIQNRISTSL